LQDLARIMEAYQTRFSLSLSIHEEKRIDFSSSPFFIPRQPQNGYLILADAIPNAHAHTLGVGLLLMLLLFLIPPSFLIETLYM
jgi:hypothetical protein